MVRIVPVIIIMGLLVGACGRSEPQITVKEDDVASDELTTRKAEEPQETAEEVALDVPAAEVGEQEAKLVKVYKSPT